MADIIVVPNFNPRWLSVEWIKTKWRPDMSSQCRPCVLAILEAGLLFREDAMALEDALQTEEALLPCHPGLKLTRAEQVALAVVLGVCVSAVPLTRPIACRGNMFRVGSWMIVGATVPLFRALRPKSPLSQLLPVLQDYTALVRRGMACVRDCHHSRGRLSSGEAIGRLLVSQQRQLCVMLQHAGAALQPACPWLPITAFSEAPLDMSAVLDGEDLLKIHHLFLILQSLFLKNVAVAHLTLSPRSHRSHGNTRNHRLYWLNNQLLPQITEPIKRCLVSLEMAYQRYKNQDAISKDMKGIPNRILTNNNRTSWQYSEVHSSIAGAGTDLRSALIKCNEMDSFLEACWTAKSKFSPSLLENDLGKLRDDVLRCLGSVDAIGVKLKRIQMSEMKILEMALQQKLPLPAVEEESAETQANTVTVSEDTVVEIDDQVFYYEKNDDYVGDSVDGVKDYLTGPGKKEIDVTKVVLGELRVKLVKREELMREREAVALENTMPEFKGRLPEFPKQIVVNTDDGNGGVDLNEDVLALRKEIGDFHGELERTGNEKMLMMERENGNRAVYKDKRDIKEGAGDFKIGDRRLFGSSEGLRLGGGGVKQDADNFKQDEEVSSNVMHVDGVYFKSYGGEMSRHDVDVKQDGSVVERSRSKDGDKLKRDYSDVKRDSGDVKQDRENLKQDVNDGKQDCSYLKRDKFMKDGNQLKQDDRRLKQDGGDVNQDSGELESDYSDENGASGVAKIKIKFRRPIVSSSTSTDSDDDDKDDEYKPLKDVRKYRVARKKKYKPKKRDLGLKEVVHGDTELASNDEGIEPVVYSLGAGLAMASLISQPARVGRPVLPAMVGEEVFTGDGEVELDSGNED